MSRTFPAKKSLTILTVIALLAAALTFSWLTQPVMASPALQAGTGTVTQTLTPTGSTTPGASTGTVTPTGSTTPAASGTAGTPAATGTTTPGTGTPEPTDTTSAFSFGYTTPTSLLPVTGGDASEGQAPDNAGTWLAVWMLGLLVLGYGLRAKLRR